MQTLAYYKTLKDVAKGEEAAKGVLSLRHLTLVQPRDGLEFLARASPAAGRRPSPAPSSAASPHPLEQGPGGTKCPVQAD